MTQVDHQWQTASPYFQPADKLNPVLSWMPDDEKARIQAYAKYDEMYWNSSNQYALRVLEDEQPLYIPNARIIADTTAHYLLKGLVITCKNAATQKALDSFLKREAFYSRFNLAKLAGVVRGDFVFHLTADPAKQAGSRISLTEVDPSIVFPIWDEDEAGKMIGCSIAEVYYDPNKPDDQFMRKLTYRIVEEKGSKRISREEAIYKLEQGWFGDKAQKVKTTIKLGLLDPAITALPIYWFKNRGWSGEDYGSSELRGVEAIAEVISQGSTDVSASLSLEGLGVYATDGGRPVDENGNETDWEVAPGKVMEVPSGAYFRRVEGVGSITPATDQIKYLEGKINDAVGLSDVAMGKVDSQVAQSGIALAIKFIPTLAKIETRDQEGLDKLTQLFYDWKTWYAIFEKETLDGDIIPVIGDKLPTDRVARLNELNNMFDRRIISAKFYRLEMKKLGYEFPSDSTIEADIEKDLARVAPAVAEPEDSEEGDEDGNASDTDKDTLEQKNSSNNRNRPNESSGTEA